VQYQATENNISGVDHRRGEEDKNNKTAACGNSGRGDTEDSGGVVAVRWLASQGGGVDSAGKRRIARTKGCT
jgi:hypothetical protein